MWRFEVKIMTAIYAEKRLGNRRQICGGTTKTRTGEGGVYYETGTPAIMRIESTATLEGK